MDVRYYFDSVDFTAYNSLAQNTWKYSLGSVIEKTTHSLTPENIRSLQIAIIGVPFDSKSENTWSPEAPKKIRAELYTLSKFENKINIADFGNLKPASSLKGNYQALRDIVDYFNELQITTIVIGGSQDLSIGICDAFNNNPYFSLSTVDAFLDIKKGKEPLGHHNYLSRIFSNQPEIFAFSLIGYQGHYPSAVYFAKTRGIDNHIRLGNLRENMILAEPVFRNSDVVSFDINVVKYAEAPGSNVAVPNGLRSEEACQLAKYAGLSTRLKVFGLFGVNVENDKNNLTIKLGAQIIWYFIEGFLHRNNEEPDFSANSTIYQVEVGDIDKPFVFIKNNVTNCWWMQLETHDKKKLFVACSQSDYEEASNNEIPGLWMKYIQKIDESVK